MSGYKVRKINGCEMYLMDESRITGSADCVIFPHNTRETARAVADYADCGITIQGARTGLNGGAVSAEGALISTSEMTGAGEGRYDATRDAYFVKLQAGITLEAMNRKIAQGEFGFRATHFFAPDPTERLASLGGMISCNASGARSYHYGGVREYVNALTVALASGASAEIRRGEICAEGREFDFMLAGERYRFSLPDYDLWKKKNAVGYYARDNMDLVDLFIGAEGTLAIITEAELGFIRCPKFQWGVLAFFPGDAWQTFLEELKALDGRGEAFLAAIEFFDGNALALISDARQEGLPPIRKEYAAAIYFEIHASEEAAAAALLEKAGDLLERHTPYAEEAVAATEPAELERLKTFRHAVPERANRVIDEYRVREPGITSLFTDIAMPDASGFYAMLETYRRSMAQTDVHYAIYGHIGDWHVHVNMLPKTMREYQTCVRIYHEWMEAAAERGGTISAEHGVGKMKAPLLGSMISPEDIAKCREIKRQFDPRGVLNKGTIFYGGEGQ